MIMLDVRCVSEEEFFRVIDSAEITNARYSKDKFVKFAVSDNELFYIEYDDRKPVAGCIVCPNFPSFGHMYGVVIQSFISGHEYGKKMIRWFDFMNMKFWFCRDMNSPELDEYYCRFGQFNRTRI